MADMRIQSTERMVGAGHSTLPDTLNRLALIGHNNDGTHKAWVDVVEAGAVGDGVTDDTAAIQAAIATGKTVYLPKGKSFKYTALSITTETNVTFTGGGQLLDGYIEVAPSSATNVRITFDDVHFAFTFLASGNNPLRFKNARRVNIRNCEFTNCDKAIYIMPQDTEQHCSRFNITENRFMTCDYNLYAERVGSPTYKWYIGDFHFVNNLCEATQITNIYGEGVDGITITDNTFFHQNVTTNKKNIYLETVVWAVISGNKCFEAGEECIYVKYFTKVTIENNHIAWPGQLVQSSGIYLTDGGIPSGETIPNSIVMGNVIEAATKHGVEVLASNMVSTISNSISYVGASTHWRSLDAFPSITHYGVLYDSSSSFGVVFLNNTEQAENSISTATTTIRGLNLYYNTATGGRSFDYNSNVLTVSGSETTINLNNKERVHLNNSTPHTISTISDGVIGQEATFFGITGNTTISEGASIVLQSASVTIPVDGSLTLKYSNSKWYEVSRSFSMGRVSADKGDAAATLTVGSSEQTQVWNTALSADRAVTLSTTGAYNGAKFRIVRTASATGAYNLNVGTGPLKAMGTAGSFCEVEYNGTSWVLTAYGTL